MIWISICVQPFSTKTYKKNKTNKKRDRCKNKQIGSIARKDSVYQYPMLHSNYIYINKSNQRASSIFLLLIIIINRTENKFNFVYKANNLVFSKGCQNYKITWAPNSYVIFFAQFMHETKWT